MKKILPFLFLTVIVSLFIGLHYFIYSSFVYYFLITDSLWKIFLASSLGFFSVSFIITSILAHFFDNALSRFLYSISAIWLGVLTYIVLTLFGAWIFNWLFMFFDMTIPSLYFWAVAIFLTCIVCAYGIYNAGNPRTTQIEVTIKNLPDAWKGKTIVHLTDVHIGHILRQKYLQGIVDMVNRHNPVAVFITGDLFDGMDGNLEHLVDPLNNMEAEHGIFYVTGNHETYLGIERSLMSLRETKARILRDEIATVDGLDIIGIDYPVRGESKDVAHTITRIPGFNPENPSILLYHVPVQIEAIAKTGVNLELCGHTHKGQIWPFGYVTNLLFKGYDYGLHIIGNYSLYTSSGVGTWWPPMRVGTKAEVVVIRLL